MNRHDRFADLSRVEVCYCDSEAAWRLALKQGLLPTAIVRSSNPSLLTSPPSGMSVEPVERSWTPERIVAVAASVDSLVGHIRTAIRRSDFARYVDLLARDAFVWSYRLPWAITLTDDDLSAPRAIISVDYGAGHPHSNGHAKWGELLANNPDLVTLSYSAADCGVDSDDPAQSPTRMQLLKYYPFSHLEYAFWRRLWLLLSRSLSRGTLYVGIDNPAIRETLVHFARRGYAICETQRPKLGGKLAEVPTELRTLLTPFLRDYLKSWVGKDLEDILVALFFDDLSASLGGFESAAPQWTRTIGQWRENNEKPVALLSNIPLPTAMLPLGRCLREAGIPLVLFQHGHSRELTKYLEYNKCISEETFADLFVCFDDKANEFVHANRHRIASVITSGVPELYHLNGRYVADSQCGEIGYIQTVIPMGGRAAAIAMTWSDLHKDRFEAELFEKSLSGLPHTVTIKPYLAPDYPGMRKSVEIVERSPNLNLYKGRMDLRYIAGNFRVIITSRGTSTLGWCVLADRPMVYLDLPHQNPLWDDAREALEKAVFYFDMAQPGAFERLREFLSQPLDVIEREWLKRADDRRRFVQRYLDSGPRKFGKRTYLGIRKFMAGRRAAAASSADIAAA